MDKTTKSFLGGILSDARQQEERIGDLELALESMREATRRVLPGFGIEYDLERASANCDALRRASERRVELIQSTIQALENVEQEKKNP